jgi:hypothetical protein
MRNINASEMPSLFAPEVLASAESAVLAGSSPAAPQADSVAHRFVGWCWGLDGDFRNSPDSINLRFWLEKNGDSESGSRAEEILLEARRLYLKRVEQTVRKAEAPREV